MLCADGQSSSNNPLRTNALGTPKNSYVNLGAMAVSNRRLNEQPRELRRRVMITARLRTGAQWSDACILNISSRGLMIRSARAGPEGSLVELRRDNHVMIARVVWRDGGRAGLQSDERLPVEQIMSLGEAAGLRLVASEGTFIERRKQPRSHAADARMLGRMLEFLGVGLLIVGLSIGTWMMVSQALERPFAKLEAVFGDRP